MKNRNKTQRDLARKRPKREPYDKVLIVCEGEKTEPTYFVGLKEHYGINSANIEICGDCDSDPSNLYKFARKRFEQERKAGDSFDYVFCVFDKDSHTTFHQTLDQISRTTPKNVFIAIYSVPCFEYWLYLHCRFTTQAFEGLPGRSACTQLVKLIQSDYLHDYAKGLDDVFALTQPDLEKAIRHAKEVRKQARLDQRDSNPTTRVHELVTYLIDIQHSKRSFKGNSV